MIGGKFGKAAVKLAWELVAEPPVLQYLNWEGRDRRDRPKKKTGIRNFMITKAILGN
jgi:hypothetical protein